MKLSIIIPVYNYKHYLGECLKSILSQEVKDIEVLVINDGSTDGLQNMSFPKEVVLINHKKNLGLAAALNTGMKAAKGEYVTWISADNYYDKGTLQKLIDFLDRNKDIGMICSNYIHFGKDQKFFTYRSENITTHALLHSNCVGASFMYKRKVHDIAGLYDVDLPCVEDWDMWIRISKNFKVRHIEGALVYFRVHDANLSRCFCRINGGKYRLKMLKKYK